MLVPLHMFMFPFSWDLDQFPEKGIGATIQSCIICLMFFCALNRGSWNISARWSSVQKDEELPPHLCLSVPSTGGLWLAYRFCVVGLSPIVSHHFLNFQQPWHPRQCVVYEKWGQTQGLRWLQRHLLPSSGKSTRGPSSSWPAKRRWKKRRAETSLRPFFPNSCLSSVNLYQFVICWHDRMSLTCLQF